MKTKFTPREFHWLINWGDEEFKGEQKVYLEKLSEEWQLVHSETIEYDLENGHTLEQFVFLNKETNKYYEVLGTFIVHEGYMDENYPMTEVVPYTVTKYRLKDEEASS